MNPQYSAILDLEQFSQLFLLPILDKTMASKITDWINYERILNK